MDRVNNQILLELMKNSRITNKQLSKKIKVSREVIAYRINKLINEKIILNFTTEINYKKLGFIAGSIYLNIKEDKQDEFIEFLFNSNYISWAVELSGIWNFGFSILGKTVEEIDARFNEMYLRFKDEILNHRFTIHKQAKYFYEKYFNERIDLKIKKHKKEEIIKIDNIDKLILKELVKNSRIELTKLSLITKISPQAVSKRIKRLEDNNYISKYYIFIDISKLNIYQYEIFITNNNKTINERLFNHLEFRLDISYIAEYIGDPYLEFGLIVKSPYDVRNKLQEIISLFKNITIIQIDLFQKEYIAISPPACVFE
jgi:Lrp/AsnC family leucine-responsive transcriptional regulator